MPKYNHQEIEKKWAEVWEKTGIFRTPDKSKKKKKYVLDFFPYPSGEGLHVGHLKGYSATDVYSHLKRRQGYNVLHPMGWDAFGLPAENYAIKKGIHPAITTAKNIALSKDQLQKMGFSYDWDREINTTDPNYFKWTQWIFLKIYESGLAYEAEMPINWCPSCKTGLANEEVVSGGCERCGTKVEKKNIRQWVLKITDYADKLLKDLDDLDWPEPIKLMQRNWIGRSEGAEIKFKVSGSRFEFPVFTTRPDTLFGATFMVLAPENPLVLEITTPECRDAVKKYIDTAIKKSDLERQEEGKDKTGVFTGAYAENPVNGEKIPIWVADYVLMEYGHGAIMAVPAHDQRDWDFANKYEIPIIEVLKGGNVKKEPFLGDGPHINSDYLNGLNKKDAIEKVVAVLSKKKMAKKDIQYKLRDWLFSRQRYWGEPIPIIHCENCKIVPVPEKDLPVLLPEVEKYEPTGTGESPLAKIEDWVNVKCPKCGGAGRRETNTMPQWAGSCWYYLRFIDPKNQESLADTDKMKNWLPVDFYVGGAEHAVLHLLYARFWHKFLYDIKVLPTKEPFQKLRNVGLILAEDGRKMSKSLGNVVNPNEIIEKFGADTLKCYELFMGPFEQTASWNMKGVEGISRFLTRVEKLFDGKILKDEPELEEVRLLNKTIKKVSEDIEEFRFNTAISALMILVNSLTKNNAQHYRSLGILISLLAPFAPYLSEELWEKLGNSESVHLEPWASYDKNYIEDEICTVIIQVNGRVRANIEMSKNSAQNDVEKEALGNPNVQKFLTGKKPKKVIYIQDKILNIVV